MQKYPPDGKKCVFRILRETLAGSDRFELILLIDNHEPYGFHQHDMLPEVHDSRVTIHASSWEEAWSIFDKEVRKLLNEKA